MATNKLEMVLTVPADASVSGFTRLRGYMKDGGYWWSASDAGAVLGIKEVRSTLRNFPDDEKGVHTMHTPGGRQETLVINEPGLWRLVLKSRVAEAERLKRWLCWEVLPSIRKHGCYTPPAIADGLVDCRSYAETCTLAIGLKVLADFDAVPFPNESVQDYRRRVNGDEWLTTF